SAQVRNEQAREVYRRLEVRRKLLVRLFPRLVLRQLQPALDAGVVDDDVQGGEVADGPVDEILAAGGGADVGTVRVQRRMGGPGFGEIVSAAGAGEDRAARRPAE